MTEHIDPQRAYSTSDVGELLGINAKTVRAMAAAGEFGENGAWPIRTAGRAQRIHAYRIAGWAVTAWRKRNAVRAA